MLVYSNLKCKIKTVSSRFIQGSCNLIQSAYFCSVTVKISYNVTIKPICTTTSFNLFYYGKQSYYSDFH